MCSVEKGCPLCGRSDCKLTNLVDGYDLWECNTYIVNNKKICFKYRDEFPNDKVREKAINLALEHLLRHPTYQRDKYWNFFYDDSQSYDILGGKINLAKKMVGYPSNVSERALRVLDNISLINSIYGQSLNIDDFQYRLFFHEEGEQSFEKIGWLDILIDFGYLKTDHEFRYYITANGWKSLDEYHKNKNNAKQAFIAMSFSRETIMIREGFRKAIEESGYLVRIIDEKEHNNQIVPEIFYEIERSKFVVVDVTYPNYGAYYEAGYAQALGKQVIICCRKTEFEGSTTKPHFDISQKAMVVWDTESDMVDKLKRRIEATVNVND